MDTFSGSGRYFQRLIVEMSGSLRSFALDFGWRSGGGRYGIGSGMANFRKLDWVVVDRRGERYQPELGFDYDRHAAPGRQLSR